MKNFPKKIFLAFALISIFSFFNFAEAANNTTSLVNNPGCSANQTFTYKGGSNWESDQNKGHMFLIGDFTGCYTSTEEAALLKLQSEYDNHAAVAGGTATQQQVTLDNQAKQEGGQNLQTIEQTLNINSLQSNSPTGFATYTPLVNIPQLDLSANGTSNLGVFLVNAFNFGIAAAVALATMMIIWGGITLATTDSWSGKSEGKTRITNALQGLAIALVSWLLLYTINPALVDFKNNALLKTPAPIPPAGFFAQQQQFLLAYQGNITPAEQAQCQSLVPAGKTYKCLCPDCVVGNAGEYLNFDCKNNCKMNQKVANSLAGLSSEIQITEAWPPTSPHNAQCHYDGGCVDLTLKTKSDSPAEMAKLYTQLKALNPIQIIYETKGSSGENTCSLYPSIPDCSSFEKTTANHFHIQFSR